jgi:hypothetical protein
MKDLIKKIYKRNKENLIHIATLFIQWFDKLSKSKKDRKWINNISDKDIVDAFGTINLRQSVPQKIVDKELLKIENYKNIRLTDEQRQKEEIKKKFVNQLPTKDSFINRQKNQVGSKYREYFFLMRETEGAMLFSRIWKAW